MNIYNQIRKILCWLRRLTWHYLDTPSNSRKYFGTLAGYLDEFLLNAIDEYDYYLDRKHKLYVIDEYKHYFK